MVSCTRSSAQWCGFVSFLFGFCSRRLSSEGCWARPSTVFTTRWIASLGQRPRRPVTPPLFTTLRLRCGRKREGSWTYGSVSFVSGGSSSYHLRRPPCPRRRPERQSRSTNGRTSPRLAPTPIDSSAAPHVLSGFVSRNRTVRGVGTVGHPSLLTGLPFTVSFTRGACTGGRFQQVCTEQTIAGYEPGLASFYRPFPRGPPRRCIHLVPPS